MSGEARTRSDVRPGARYLLIFAGAVPVLVAAVVWTTREPSRGAGDGEADGAHVAQADPHAGHASPRVVDAGAHAGHTGGEAASDAIELSAAMLTTLGVGVATAERAPLVKMIRTNGSVVYDETRLGTITLKFDGYVERLHVNFTGQAVRRGAPLLEIYSPELVAAQEELLSALRMQARAREDGIAPAVRERASVLVESARRRLQLWDMPAEELRQIEEDGAVQRTVTVRAPLGGFVTEKLVQAGEAVRAGMPLYRVADLGVVWIDADVYEQDLRHVRIGEAVEVEVAAYPGETFRGRVSYIHPDMKQATRTVGVRIELPNADARLKPGMFAVVQIEAQVAESAVLVPRDAVMHAGTHAMVFVEEGPGRFRAREVRVGAEAGGRTEILSGLNAGERVADRANFLLDAESRLGGMPGMNH